MKPQTSMIRFTWLIFWIGSTGAFHGWPTDNEDYILWAKAQSRVSQVPKLAEFQDAPPSCFQEGFVSHPTDCTKFIRCACEYPLDGGPPILIRYDFDCPLGTVYDPSTQICNFPDQVRDLRLRGCEERFFRQSKAAFGEPGNNPQEWFPLKIQLKPPRTPYYIIPNPTVRPSLPSPKQRPEQEESLDIWAPSRKAQPQWSEQEESLNTWPPRRGQPQWSEQEKSLNTWPPRKVQPHRSEQEESLDIWTPSREARPHGSEQEESLNTWPPRKVQPKPLEQEESLDIWAPPRKAEPQPRPQLLRMITPDQKRGRALKYVYNLNRGIDSDEDPRQLSMDSFEDLEFSDQHSRVPSSANSKYEFERFG